MPVLDTTALKLQKAATTGVHASEQIVTAAAQAAAAGDVSAATDEAASGHLAAVLDTVILLLNEAITDQEKLPPGLVPPPQIEEPCSQTLSIVGAVVIVVVAVVIAAFTFGAGAGAVVSTLTATVYVLQSAVATLPRAGLAIAPHIMAALNHGKAAHEAGASSGVAVGEALSNLYQASRLLAKASSQYRPARLSAAESPQTVDRALGLLRALIVIVKASSPLTKDALVLPKLEQTAGLVSALLVRLRVRIDRES
jgi:hypothetical protein